MRGRGRDDPHRVRQDRDEGDPDEFLFKAVKEDNNVQSNWHDRCGTKPHDDAEYEFKGVNDKSKEDEDLHNEWKYNHMISDELTTTENAKISLESAGVA